MWHQPDLARVRQNSECVPRICLGLVPARLPTSDRKRSSSPQPGQLRPKLVETDPKLAKLARHWSKPPRQSRPKLNVRADVCLTDKPSGSPVKIVLTSSDIGHVTSAIPRSKNTNPIAWGMLHPPPLTKSDNPQSPPEPIRHANTIPPANRQTEGEGHDHNEHTSMCHIAGEASRA